jgi:hydroxymethylglutaryl-CoA lyase
MGNFNYNGENVEVVECPRDAMQGIKQFIPTEIKIKYITKLLSEGFDVLDCGSFVSPAAVPQMADTAEVIDAISKIETSTELLVIVANERGAIRAAAYPKIKYLGYPFSISETFQRRNTNQSRQDAFLQLAKIQEIALASGKQVVAYISMAFGNPYGDDHTNEMIREWAEKIAGLGIRVISLADTTGLATPDQIETTYKKLIPHLPHVKIGGHFHVTLDESYEKIDAALKGGCRRLDGAILGFGGCPFAKDVLVGNVPTELIIEKLGKKIGRDLLEEAAKTYSSF